MPEVTVLLSQEVPHTNEQTILVAEDNPINRELVSMFLTKRGFQVRVVKDGAQAVEMAQNNNFALIVMDVAMPGMDGCQATALIRKHEGTHRHTPIVALTAYGNPETRKACFDSGMDDVLIKPIRAAEFFTTLEKYVTH
jgi:CheY-like chemotaxis protein